MAYKRLGDGMRETGSGFTYRADELGRSFMVEMPRDKEPTEIQTAKSRVLVVDDEKLIADTCTEILKGAGFDVRAAYDGRAALDMATVYRPDYLLTDVLMPRMNGVELAIAISKASPYVKILLFSGQAGISEILRGGHDQGYDFELIAKPIHPMKLIERLQRLEE